MDCPRCGGNCILHPVGIWQCKVCSWDDWGLIYDVDGNRRNNNESG